MQAAAERCEFRSVHRGAGRCRRPSQRGGAQCGSGVPVDAREGLQPGQPGARERVGTESSPYGVSLGVRYLRSEPSELVGAAVRAMAGWRAAGPRRRAGLAVEMLCRLHDRSHEIAHALHHTTGQAYTTAHRSGGAQAQDRGLEAVAHALTESVRRPGRPVLGASRQVGRPGADGRHVHCRPARRLVAHRLPGLPHLERLSGPLRKPGDRESGDRQPHPRAVLPLALTVQVARDVLTKAGHDPNVVTLVAEKPGEKLASRLATDPAVRAHRLHRLRPVRRLAAAQARQAGVYATSIGANTVLVDSTDDYRRMLRELALSLSLCSGQSCTAPQNILVPSSGITTDEGHKPIGRFSVDLGRAVKRLLADPRRAAGILGAIGSDRIRSSLRMRPDAEWWCTHHLPVAHPDHPAADIRTPLIVRLEAHDEQVYSREWPGPSPS